MPWIAHIQIIKTEVLSFLFCAKHVNLILVAQTLGRKQNIHKQHMVIQKLVYLSLQSIHIRSVCIKRHKVLDFILIIWKILQDFMQAPGFISDIPNSALIM